MLHMALGFRCGPQSSCRLTRQCGDAALALGCSIEASEPGMLVVSYWLYLVGFAWRENWLTGVSD